MVGLPKPVLCHSSLKGSSAQDRFSMPAVKKPCRAYWICFTPRTGSALLCQLLRATGVAGRPEEHFWRDNEPLYRAQWHVTSYRDYLDRALEEGTTPTASLERKWTPGCIFPTFS